MANGEKYFGDGIQVTAGFDLSAQLPLDYRTLYNSWDEDNLKKIPVTRLYEGMIVVDAATKTVKKLKSIPQAAKNAFECTWEEVGKTYEASDFDIKDLTDSTNLKQTWSGKQDKLTAGDHIEIYTDESDNKLKIKGTYSYTLPTASDDTLGGIKVGNNLSIDSNGTLSGNYSNAKAPDEEQHTEGSDGLMSAADKAKLDGIPSDAEANVITSIKVNGDEITPLDKSVDITISDYTLPTASTTELGGIKVGEGLHMESEALSAATSSDITPINKDEITFNSFRNALIEGGKVKDGLTFEKFIEALFRKTNEKQESKETTPPEVTGSATYTLKRNNSTEISIPDNNILSYEVGTADVEGTYTLTGTYTSSFTDGKVLTHTVTMGESKDSTSLENAGCEINGSATWNNGSSQSKSDSISFGSGDNVTTWSITLTLNENLVTLLYKTSTVENPTNKIDGHAVICNSYGEALYPNYNFATKTDVAIVGDAATDTVSANSVTISTYFNQYMKVNNDWTKISNNKEIAADFKNGTEFYILSGTPHIKYYSMVVMDRNINDQPNDWESGSVYLALPGGNSPTFTVEKPTSGLYKAYTKFKYKGDTVSKSNMASGSGYNAGKFKITIL